MYILRGLSAPNCHKCELQVLDRAINAPFAPGHLEQMWPGGECAAPVIAVSDCGGEWIHGGGSVQSLFACAGASSASQGAHRFNRVIGRGDTGRLQDLQALFAGYYLLSMPARIAVESLGCE